MAAYNKIKVGNFKSLALYYALNQVLNRFKSRYGPPECFVYFRFVDRLPDRAAYIAFCFLIRTIASIGGAMLTTSTYSMLTLTFKAHIPIIIVSFYFLSVKMFVH